MKKLINEPENVVREQLEGMEAAHPDRLNIQYEPTFITRKDAPIDDKVGIISGGGSGHEPLHAGFVGPGMLDGACPGDVFTSPTPDQMQEATQAVDGGAGVLHIVKNYEGDVMNFDMGAEMVEDQAETEVNSVIINDDVAVEDSTYTSGRRGVGATVLAEKICGAAAERGDSLEKVTELCERVNDNARSMNMALTPCTTPEAGEPTFELGDDEMEIGVGIHGEPGRETTELQSADEITEILAEPVIEDLPSESGDRVLAFVNSMGGTPDSELYIVFRHLAQICENRGFSIERSLVGRYITSLEMQGCSITLLKLDDEMIELWDAPVNAPGLSWGDLR